MCHHRSPFWLSCWWPWILGPWANVLAPWLWPALPPYPTRCPTTFQTNMVTHPLSRNHTPRRNTSPLFQVPPPFILNSIFSSSSVLSFVSATTAEKAAGSCLPAATLPGRGAGPGPEAPSPPTRAVFGHISRPWDCSPVPPRAFGPGVYPVLSRWAFQATTYMHSGIPPGQP